MKNISKIALALVAFCAVSFAQTGFTTTTLTNALSLRGNGSQTGLSSGTILVGSTTGMFGPGLNPSYGSIGSPSGANITYLFIDEELFRVNSVPSTTAVVVERGVQGTKQGAHNAGATVYVAVANQLVNSDPTGACNATLMAYLPQFSFTTGSFWTCPTSGPNANTWTQSGTTNTFTFTDGDFWIPFSACQSAVSGNSSGTNGFTVTGASNTPVVQASTSATGTNTQTYVCTITAPSRLTANKGVSITDATFFYGVQTSALGTQVATLASGTMNSSIVFAKIAYPAAAASETASTVTPVRADTGTLVIAPVVGSFNTATTTAGAFYSAKFVPSAPIALTTDLQQVLLTVTLQCAATSATVTNSPGLLVHYILSPL